MICVISSLAISSLRKGELVALLIDVAHSVGVQNVVLAFFCLQETIFNVLVIFFVLKLGVYVCLVMSLLILSFYLSKQLKESSRTQNLGVKRL